MNSSGKLLCGHLCQVCTFQEKEMVCFQFTPRVQKKTNTSRKDKHVQKTETLSCLRLETWGRAMVGTWGRESKVLPPGPASHWASGQR